MNKRAVRLLSFALASAVTLSSCGSAKDSIYVDTDKRVKGVLSQTLNIPESKIVRIQTLSNIGLVPGKNDDKVRAALEAEFKIKIDKGEIRPNETVVQLITVISDYRTMVAERKDDDAADEPLANPGAADEQAE